MIKRIASAALQELAKGFPALLITGPRQSGKTTLTRTTFPNKPYFSLEDPDLQNEVIKDPRGFLARCPNGAILDEIQRAPDFFSYLQTHLDLDGRMGLFILTGSQQFGLQSKVSQSLAGRVGLLQLLPLSGSEIRTVAGLEKMRLDELLWKGLYPAVYDRPVSPVSWYESYFATYVERDVRQVASIEDLNTFQRFIRLCATRTGQLVNVSELGNDAGVSHTTAKRWLSILEASYILYWLHPHFQNFGKRLVKQSKLYFYDTGFAASLMKIQDADHLSVHPARGALFETFIVTELLKQKYNAARPSNRYFWRSHTGIEVDVLIENSQNLTPVEIKSGMTVNDDFFQSLRQFKKFAGPATGPLQLIYGGDASYPFENTQISSWRELPPL